MKRLNLLGIVAILIINVAVASASTSTFYGTTGVDTILVGRGSSDQGMSYFACINGTWVEGAIVTGPSDTVYVYGNNSRDTITIRNVEGTYTCGIDPMLLHRMDYVYGCPAMYIHGDAGNDVIYGAQCAEHLYGDAGYDTIFGGAGYDYIWGGTENDCIEDTTLSYLSCGDGTDSHTDDGSWKDCEIQSDYCFL
jgi:Ca2+-binding RTX toxin-like protein